MMSRYLLSVFLVLFFSTCTPQVKESYPKKKISTKKQVVTTYQSSIAKAIDWVDHLQLDLDYIQEKKLGSKKFLAEYLGFYWHSYKVARDSSVKAQIRAKIQPYYRYTKTAKYHNMALLSDKLFKKNSMSYLRVLWLLDNLDFDTNFYRKEVDKIQDRLDQQMPIRGNWQKAVFKEYYAYFKLKLPEALVQFKDDNGVIDQALPIEQYTKNTAYKFTHFIFAAFEYGNKQHQNRFTKKQMHYIQEILPKLTHYYRAVKPNIDLLGELVSCMVYLGFTDTEEFVLSYNYLIGHQNTNGSWGNYEKARQKIGDDINFRAYLHTTLVVTEAILAYNEGEFFGSSHMRSK